MPTPCLRPLLARGLQSSLLVLYELLAAALGSLGETPDPRLLELLAALTGGVEPGGERHMYWARLYRQEMEVLEGRSDPAFRHADKLCFAAHQARYGAALSKDLYLRMLVAERIAEEGGDEFEEGS
jgi:hypothetical protein